MKSATTSAPALHLGTMILFLQKRSNQIGWKAVAAGRALKIPIVGFYHSHFPEACLRGTAKFLGQRGTHCAMKLTRTYVRKLYNRFQATLVPSEKLAAVLWDWGVHNVQPVRLGAEYGSFQAGADDGQATRESLRVERDRKLLLYVGRLAKEKNAQTLFRAFELLRRADRNQFHSW
jgi:alpha-1,6-mannosyltransferase